ncbi:MAG: type VI secretion system ATPase TssH, partial [Comamonadaceae bacterium]
MSEISRTALFGKLNSLAYKAIEGATVFCKMRGNPYVELEHWFAQMLQAQDSDLHRAIQHYGLDISVIAKDMTAALDRLPRGATAISDFSPHIENAIERAWTYATLQFGEAQVRTGYLLVGMLKTQSLRNPLFNLSKQFEKIKVEDLADNFAQICDASPESQMRAQDGTGMGSGTPGEEAGAMAPAAMGKGDALKKFAVDLTEKAKKGEMDPVTGRDEEIRQIVDILMRRRQNNPLLTGEAGVGKTAVVEGFAQRLARGDVPPQLKDVKLLTLDIGLLQAGASMKGEFEQRLRQVIDEVQSSPTPIILFIDEIHTLVGAGGAAGTGDAANLLKPALARGNLRTIGATTWAEYKKYIEKDPALTRRFQVVQVPEPDETKAILMLRGVASVLEKHHRVQLLDEAIEAAVKLSHRYIPARQLPDKAVSLLDTACARVAVSQHATPPEVEDCMRRIEGLKVEQEIIGREETIGVDVTKRAATVSGLLIESNAQLETLNARWQEEKGLIDRLLELRAQLRKAGAAVDSPTADASPPVRAEPGAPPPVRAELVEAGAGTSTSSVRTDKEASTPRQAQDGPSSARTELLDELHALQAKIHAVQGESPLILPSVDEQAVASVVADWTGIPVGRMVKNEVQAVLELADTLNKRVIGQKHGLEMIARRIQTSRARLDNPQKPIGVFMLCGTSGVGKTETALALAEALYGGEQNIITINMSEFQEAHTVSTLKGAPPG